MKKMLITLIGMTIIGVSIVFLTSQSGSPPNPPTVEVIHPDGEFPQSVTEGETEHIHPEEPAPSTSEAPALPEEPPAAPVEMLSPNFAKAEFACDCAGYCDGWPAQMDSELITRLQALRDRSGGPLIITSGVRCERRNTEVGGVPYSYHLRGRAADLYSPDVRPGDLLVMARDLGLNVIPYYHHGYIHVELVR